MILYLWGESEGGRVRDPEDGTGNAHRSGYDKPFQASTSLPTTVMRPRGFELPALQLDCNPSKITSTRTARVHSCLRGGSATKPVFEGALESEPQISHSFPPST